MKLNFRRGFFRIWIAVAVLWIVPALVINSKDLGLTAQPESGPTVSDANGSGPVRAPPSLGQDRAAQLAVFEMTGPDGSKYDIEAPLAEEAMAAAKQYYQTGGQDSSQAGHRGGTEPIFISPTNGARIWTSGLFDDIPTREELRAARQQLTPSEQQAALRSARNEALAVVFIPPLALLVLGVSLGWIVRGFSPKPSPPV